MGHFGIFNGRPHWVVRALACLCAWATFIVALGTTGRQPKHIDKVFVSMLTTMRCVSDWLNPW